MRDLSPMLAGFRIRYSQLQDTKAVGIGQLPNNRCPLPDVLFGTGSEKERINGVQVQDGYGPVAPVPGQQSLPDAAPI